jgi:hypothetical protein
VKEVMGMLLEQLLAQPAPVRLSVGVLAVGAGALLWRRAPRLVTSDFEPSRYARPLVASPGWTNLVRWSYWISMRVEALAIIGFGVSLVAGTLGGA